MSRLSNIPPQDMPEVPEAAYVNVDSMLSRKYGKEVANYFSGSPLNRVSFLRTNHPFLSTAVRHPSTSFLLFDNLSPLTKSTKELASATFKDVQPLIGDDPYGKEEEELIKEYSSEKFTPQLVFLGLDETKEGVSWKDQYKGQPVFALDVTPKGSVREAAQKLVTSMKERGYEFDTSRMNLALPPPQAAIFALARQILDWNARNPFCSQCGQPTLSVNAGFKRACPPTDLASLGPTTGTSTATATPHDRPPCASRKGISNISFPRTDATVIMAIVSSDGQNVLLGRQKRYPPYWYSTLAGFLEPAESIEEAVRREVWEEAGVRVGRVVVHSTQPWPYPANLMIGAIGQALPDGETIDLGNDPELEDARWVPLEELRESLRVGTSAIGEKAGPGYVEGGLRLPPRTAIANQLLAAVANGFVSGGTSRM